MEATRPLIWQLGKSLSPALKIVIKSFLLPFSLLGIFVLVRLTGLIHDPSLESFRQIAAAFASADSASIHAQVNTLALVYFILVFLCLTFILAFAPPSTDQHEGALDKANNGLSRLLSWAGTTLHDKLPSGWSEGNKRTIALLIVCVTPMLLLFIGIGNKSAEQRAELEKARAAAPAPSASRPETWASVLMPDGTVVRGPAEVKPGPDLMTYVITLTAHSK